MRPTVILFLILVLGTSSVREASAARPAFEFSAEAKLRQHLVQVALGREPADLIVRGATVLNVFTLQWEQAQDLVVRSRHPLHALEQLCGTAGSAARPWRRLHHGDAANLGARRAN